MRQRTRLPEAAFPPAAPMQQPGSPEQPFPTDPRLTMMQGGISPLDPLPQPAQPNREYRERAIQIRRELEQLEKSGRLPEGFDLRTAMADSAFVRLTATLPPYAAVRVYAAEQRAENAEKAAMENIMMRLQNRETLPRPARTDMPVNPQRDYDSMSSEEFRKLEQELKHRARNGLATQL